MRSRAGTTVTCVSTTTGSVCNSRLTTNGSRRVPGCQRALQARTGGDAMMKSKSQQVRFLSKLALLTGTTVLALLLSSLAHAQQKFNTPDAAVEALVAAARRGDTREVISILGPGSQELVSSGDPVEDANVRKEYLTAYDAQHRIVT